MKQTADVSDVVGFTPYNIVELPLSVSTADEYLTIHWDNGQSSDFHYLWLRDNCTCAECVSTLTREQMFEICDVPLDIKAISATITDENRLSVQWDFDSHQSLYHPGWLKAHCYSEEAREQRKILPKIWDKQRISQQLPVHAFSKIMQQDADLLTWLRDLRDYGITLVTAVDTTGSALKAVAERIAFIRETNFGTLFEVKAKPNANSTAYTTLRLPLHTDLPTRELQPGLQFLHCLINDASGGESILVDGFKIAEHMRQHHPDDFKALSTLSMSFYNKDKDSDYRFKGPALVTDSSGAVVEVRLANFLRGPLDIPADQVMSLYSAYRCFMQLTREARFQYFHRLNAGDLLVFDNRRVLHARNAFDLKQGERHLQGCYVDRDELLSRIRVLERSCKLGE